MLAAVLAKSSWVTGSPSLLSSPVNVWGWEGPAEVQTPPQRAFSVQASQTYPSLSSHCCWIALGCRSFLIPPSAFLGSTLSLLFHLAATQQSPHGIFILLERGQSPESIQRCFNRKETSSIEVGFLLFLFCFVLKKFWGLFFCLRLPNDCIGICGSGLGWYFSNSGSGRTGR